MGEEERGGKGLIDKDREREREDEGKR